LITEYKKKVQTSNSITKLGIRNAIQLLDSNAFLKKWSED